MKWMSGGFDNRRPHEPNRGVLTLLAEVWLCGPPEGTQLCRYALILQQGGSRVVGNDISHSHPPIPRQLSLRLQSSCPG